MKNLLVVSGDAHASPPIDQIVGYLDGPARTLVDDLVRENWNFTDTAVKRSRPSPELLERFDRDNLVRAGGEYGGGNPRIRLQQMDAEGVAAEIVHPSTQMNAMPFFRDHSSEARVAGSRAYNRWLADFMAECGGRLFGVIEPGGYSDMDAALGELTWGREHGFVSVTAPSGPDLPVLSDRYFEPLWSACEDLGLVVSVHAGGSATGKHTLDFRAFLKELRADQPVGDEMSAMNASSNGSERNAANAAMQEKDSPTRLLLQQPRRVIWQLMVGGVLDRHPNLKVALTEVRADWVPATLDHLTARLAEKGISSTMTPHEYWARNFMVVPSSIHRSEVGLRYDIGVDRLAFGTDYPHWEGTWPNTPMWLRDAFRGVSEDELRAIVGLNLASYYDLPVRRLEEVAARVGPTVADVMGGTAVDDELLEDFDRRAGYLRDVDPFFAEEIDKVLDPDLDEVAASV